ncbi:hypothetical protein ABFA07_017981 [Porites harrisoni]
MMEKFETSLSGKEHKLVNKMSALENNVSTALSNIEGRLESLEGQSLTHFSRCWMTRPSRQIRKEKKYK